RRLAGLVGGVRGAEVARRGGGVGGLQRAFQPLAPLLHFRVRAISNEKDVSAAEREEAFTRQSAALQVVTPDGAISAVLTRCAPDDKGHARASEIPEPLVSGTLAEKDEDRKSVV